MDKGFKFQTVQVHFMHLKLFEKLITHHPQFLIQHDLFSFLGGGNLVQLGACLLPHPVCQVPLMMNRLSISGSIIGGIKETQEMVDFCFKHKIYPECQSIEAKDIDWAWDQLEKTNPDGVRFVIDIKKSLENKDFLP